MRRIIILAAILAVALAGTAWAELPAQSPRITYGGYVHKYLDEAIPYVTADTLICVFNPNNVIVNGVGIAVFDSAGTKQADATLLDPGSSGVTSIVAKGWAWRALSDLVPPGLLGEPATKYTFVVYWIKPVVTPYRAMVIEIKEIIYKAPPHIMGGEACWMPWLFETWSETSLGATGVKGK
jgi:hypothetical protein